MRYPTYAEVRRPRRLPEKLGLPDPKQVEEDNPHGGDWELVESGDQGPKANPFARYYATYRSSRGYSYRADYFYIEGRWVLGAN